MNSSLLFFSTVTKNSCKKQGHYNLLRGFATAPPPLDFPKTLVGITFTTSNKSNSNLFYIRNM